MKLPDLDSFARYAKPLHIVGRWLVARRTPPSLPPYAYKEHSVLARLGHLVGVLALMFFCLIYGFIYALVTPYLLTQLIVPIGILALLAIWALPDTDRAPTGPIVFLLFAFFITLSVWPRYLALELPGLPWITFTRITSIPMLVMLMLCVSLSPSFRSKMATALSDTPNVWKFLTIFAVVQFLVIPVSPNPLGSLNKVVNSQIMWTGVFFAAVYVFLKPGRTAFWAALLWAMTLLICGIGVAEQMESKVLWADHIPDFLKVEDEIVLRILSGTARAAIGLHRVQASFTTSLGLAEYLALTAPFILHFAIGNYKVWVKIAAALTAPLMLFVVLVTDSRLGAVGFLLAVLLYPLFWGLLRWRRQLNSIFGPAVVLAYPAIFVLGVTASFAIGRLRNQIWGNGAHDASNQSRIDMYKQGIPLVLERPWGYGPGQAAGVLGFQDATGLITIDTYYMAVALDSGIIGFVSYYGMLLWGIYYSGRTVVEDPRPDRDTGLLVPITISLISFFVIKSVFSNEDNHPLMFMMLGVAVALVHRVRSKQRAEAARLAA